MTRFEQRIVNEFSELHAKATPGVWKDSEGYGNIIWAKDEAGEFMLAEVRGLGHFTGKGHGGLAMSDEDANKQMDANAAFIAFAHNNLPVMISIIERQAAELELCVVPPCKVGDTVYRTYSGKIQESKVVNAVYESLWNRWKVFTVPFDRIYWEDSFGKTVFIDRVQAEAAAEVDK